MSKFKVAVMLEGATKAMAWWCDRESAEADIEWANINNLPAIAVELGEEGGIASFGVSEAAASLWEEMVKITLDLE